MISALPDQIGRVMPVWLVMGAASLAVLFPDITSASDRQPADSPGYEAVDFLKNNLLRPPMQVFLPDKDYDGATQNWSMLQLENGAVLIANSNGILKYDGRQFTKITDIDQPVRDFAVDNYGHIFVSGSRLFGRLYADERGNWRFEDLWETLPDIPGNHVAWQIKWFEEALYLRFTNAIVRHQKGEGVMLMPDREYMAAAMVIHNDRMFVPLDMKDLYEITDGEPEHYYSFTDGRASTAISIPFKSGPEDIHEGLLFNAYTDLLLFDPGRDRFTNLHTPAILEDFIRSYRAYSAIALSNGYVAVGSVSGGLLVLDESLNQVLRLSTEDGLPSNTILGLHEDREGGLWLLSGNGLVRLDFFFPYWKTIRNRHIAGSVYSIASYRDRLLIGTNERAYILTGNELIVPPDRQNVSNVWDMVPVTMQDGSEHLVVVNDNIWLAAFENDGFYTLEQNTGQDYVRPNSIRDMITHPDHPGWIILIENARITRKKLELNSANRLEITEYTVLTELSGVLEFSRFDHTGSLWFSDLSGGVFRLYSRHGIDGFFSQSPEVDVQIFSGEKTRHSSGESDEDGKDDSRLPDLFSFAWNGDQFLFLGEDGKGFYRIKPDRWSGSRPYTYDDFDFHKLERPINFIYNPVEFGDEVLYSAAIDEDPVVMRMQKTGELVIDSIMGVHGNDYRFTTGFFDEKNLLLGGNQGVIGYRDEFIHYLRYDEPFQAIIQSVHIQGDSLVRGPVASGLFAGAAEVNENPVSEQSRDRSENISFPHAGNEFRFTFSPGSLNFGGDRIEYQTRLVPFDDSWSAWSDRFIREYTTLPAGSYTFMVRARNPYGNISEPALYAFSIIPPWHATWWARLFFAAVFLFALFASVHRYTEYRKKINMQRLMAEQAEELEKLNSMRTTLFMNISHELRTPLTLIMGSLEQIREVANSLGPDWERRIRIAWRNGHRLHQLVEQVLDLTRLDSRKMQVSVQKIELNVFLRRTLELFESLTDRKKISLKSILPEEKSYLYVDVDKFEKIIVNLISNAIKFSRGGGLVTVSMDDSGDEVVIKVIDNGQGIEEERLPKIFDRFHSRGGQIYGNGEGLGIGLAITREFVNLHKGSITAESRLGEGTTFTLSFPRNAGLEKIYRPAEVGAAVTALPPEESRSVRISGMNSPSGESKSGILLVEDNEDMSNYIGDILAGDHYHMISAKNGLEGKKQLSMTRPDLIITDVMMPEMDGFEFVEYVRSQPEYRHIPVIMLTAKVGTEDRIQGYRIGASDYLAKPFHEQELKVRIRNLLRFKEEREKQKDEAAGGSPSQDTRSVRSFESEFMQRLKSFVEERITHTEITTEELSEAVNLSRRQLYRRLKSLTGFTPAEFVREIRFLHARILLENRRKQTISEVAYACGFSNPAYFSRLFKERFGVLPRKYLSQRV